MEGENAKLNSYKVLIWFAIIVPVLSVVSPLPVFGEDIFEEARPLLENELEEARGGYAGFYLSVDYAGNVINTSITPVEGEGPLTTGGGTIVDAEGEQVKITAQVGELSGISGIVQIIQVPGTNNIINAVMNVDMTIINVMSEDAAANIGQILSGLYGAP